MLTHTAQVLFIPAAGEELGQGVLLEGGDGAGVKAQLLPEVRQQAAGQDHEADTYGGGDGLGKGVEIDHLLAAVDGEQGGDGTAYKAELAVVIVLQDDPRRDLLRPAQQLLAAGDGHHQTGGIVVAGRDVDHVGAVDMGDLAVAGVLHAVETITAQQLHQQVVQHLGAGTHDDLLGSDLHGTELPQVGGDGLPQGPGALRRRGPQQAGALLQNGLAHESGPDRKGKVLGGDGVGGQIQEPDRLAGRRRLLRGRGDGCGRRQHGADEIALLLHTGEVALGHQLFVGILYSDDADLKMGSQGALAGQLLPCRQTAGENVRLHPAVELFIQAEARLFVQGIGEHWTGSFHLVLTSKIKMDILIIPVATIIQIVNESKGFFNSYPLTPPVAVPVSMRGGGRLL